MLDVGEKPGEFELTNQHGESVRWSSLRGKKVVFFFYPKADTPGCTKEACAFRDLKAEFETAGVAVFGVSADTVKRQSSFDTRHSLGLPLLADPERVVLGPWGIFGEKKMYGKTVQGIVRSTFLFDEEGTVVRRWSPVKVDGHVEQVLAAVRG